MTPVTAPEVCARGAIHARGRLETFVDVISAVVSLPTGLTDTGVTSLGILTALVVIAEVQSSEERYSIQITFNGTMTKQPVEKHN